MTTKRDMDRAASDAPEGVAREMSGPPPRGQVTDKTEEYDMRGPKKRLREKAGLTEKDTNPKDAVGIRKWRQISVIPCTVIWELGVALLEGARKYGRHNYRVAGVRASVYYDAAVGHLQQWWEGEDVDPDSGVHHVTKAIASLTVLRDAMIQGRYVDDRPPKTDLEPLRKRLQRAVDDLHERHPDPRDAFLEGDQYKGGDDDDS